MAGDKNYKYVFTFGDSSQKNGCSFKGVSPLLVIDISKFATYHFG